MNLFFKKVQRVLQSPQRLQRILQAINKSPLRYVTKCVAVALQPGLFFKRRGLIKQETLSPFEQSVVRDLQEKGYAEISNSVFEDQLRNLGQYALVKIGRTEEISKKEILKNKDFWVRLSDEDLQEKNLTSSHVLVSTALNEQLLKIAGAYLGGAPFLDYVLLTLSRFSAGENKASQLWHCDRDDVSMLKFFVYLTDVKDLADGPFTFFDAKHSEKVPNSFFMRHLNDAEVNPPDAIRLTRPKFSCFLVDTSRCYHMGSRMAEGHERVMYTALYTALPSNYPVGGKSKYALSQDSQLSRLALAALSPRI